MRAYTYGLLPPITNAELVENQMVLGHRYRNKLIEIERRRRDAVREVTSRLVDPEDQARVDQLLKDLEEARTQIAAVRAKERRRAESKEQRDRAREIGAQLKEARARMKERRRSISDEDKAQLDAIKEAAFQEIRDARGASGVYWGTYLIHEQAMRASATAPTPPSFLPWRGEGRVSVQIQGGIGLDELETDTQVQIIHRASSITEAYRPSSSRNFGVPHNLSTDADRRIGRGALNGRTLRLRVGSNGRDPIWAEWPMILHRPLPPNAKIKVVTVSLRRRSARWEWSAQFIVDDAASDPRPIPPDRSDLSVALNLGYAQRENGGIRVGYLVAEDGWTREIVMPERDVQALDKADAIRSQRDKNADDLRTKLSAWIAEQDPASLPEWFREEVEHLPQWKTSQRFLNLAESWQRNYWDAGDAGFGLIHAWRDRDTHLSRYETGMRSTALRRRLDGYRCIAREVANRYLHLVVDDTDLRRLARLADPESSEQDAWPAARRQRTVAAPHELRAALQNAFGAARIQEMSAVDVTRTCNTCGHRNEPRAESRVVHCAACGTAYDQDANACRNLLRDAARVIPSNDEPGEPTKRGRGYKIRKRVKDPTVSAADESSPPR